MADTSYVAGACNIGPAEIALRRRFGWIALGVTVVLFVALVRVGVRPGWRLFVFFPATMSAAGFLQAHFRFCSGFAGRGVFNFGSVGQTRAISDDDSRAKDRRRGNQIAAYSILIGAAIAVASAAVRW